ncbi:MAG: hypothetical protein ABFC73_11210 [Clostridiaceae bacterium]
MESIYIHLEHCYGIPLFDEIFHFDERRKAHLIYAPNGTMKSSFAHTLSDICVDPPVESRDRYFPNLPYKRIVKHASATGANLAKEEILVVEPFKDDYESSRMNVLLADRALKSRYDRVQHEIDEALSRLLTALYNLSGKRPADTPFMKDFSISESELLGTLSAVYDEYKGKVIPEYPDIKYSTLFTDDAVKVLADPKIVRSIDSYFEQYLALITKSDVFEVYFDHNNAETTLESLSKNGFFKASHKVQLRGSELGLGEKEYTEAIDKEKKRIIDVQLADEFQKLDDALNAKNGTRNLRAYLASHKTLIPELHELGELKKRIWIYYLFQNEPLFTEAVLCFRRNEKELKEIITAAKTQTTQWQMIVEEFNNRFINMPFSLEVENKEDVILKELKPTLTFRFRCGNDSVPARREQLQKTLSEGEKKALYLLNVLFEVRARANLPGQTLIIFDDIADSFDYKNKYAIIEYLIEIIRNDHFLPIIMTHNFDFYRTLASRAGLRESSHFIISNSTRVVIQNGRFFEDVFCSWHDDAYTNAAVFISSIAFIRNLTQYQYGKSDPTYKFLTSLLHYYDKSVDDITATGTILMSELFLEIAAKWNLDPVKFSFSPSISVFDFIIDTADQLAGSFPDPIMLENKVMFSIAIRLFTERFMIRKINDPTKTDISKRNRTRQLYDLCSFDTTKPNEKEEKRLIDRVLIMTSENIHINSFMYEPLIDMSLDELVHLYNEVTRKLV